MPEDVLGGPFTCDRLIAQGCRFEPGNGGQQTGFCLREAL